MALYDNALLMAAAVCSKSVILRIVQVNVFEAKFTGADPFARVIAQT
jgi:hypothetical protein